MSTQDAGDASAVLHIALARHEGWLALKDAFYNVIIAHAAEPGHGSLGDALDRAFLERLAALRLETSIMPGASDDATALTGAVLRGATFDLGYDFGRHIFGARLVIDDLATVVAAVAEFHRRMHGGTTRVQQMFHRSATLSFRPSALLANGDPALVAAWYAGTWQGALEEVFNCEAHISRKDEKTLAVDLGNGRNTLGLNFATGSPQTTEHDSPNPKTAPPRRHDDASTRTKMEHDRHK